MKQIVKFPLAWIIAGASVLLGVKLQTVVDFLTQLGVSPNV